MREFDYMKTHEVKLHQQLAEIGLEKTPEEIGDLIDDTRRLAELVDEDLYNWFKSMTPGRIFVEARNSRISVKEFIEIRDMIITVYERTNHKEMF
jgi:hypothetical protein